MSHLSNYFEGIIGNFFRSAAATKASTHFIALFTQLPAEDGSNGVEVSGGGYARVQYNPADANWSAPVDGNGTLNNLLSIAFAMPSADWGTIVGFGIYSAITAGNLLIVAPLLSPKSIMLGDPPAVFAPGSLTIIID